MSARRVVFETTPADENLRLDQLLPRHVPELSRRSARLLIELGGVFVDRGRVKIASRTLRAGRTVEVHIGGALERASGGMGRDARQRDAAALPRFRIVHEDADLIIVDKPAGLLVAPTPESDRGNLADLLSRRVSPRESIFVVHRIDLPTSGLVVLARSERANRALAERFRTHDVEREYLAVVAGAFPDDLGCIETPIDGRRAVTHLASTRRFADVATQVRCRLETGRTHQIRIHLAGIGHPVLGDAEHGAEHRTTRPPPRLALHATVLGFVHPASGERVRYESPWPDDLSRWTATLEAS